MKMFLGTLLTLMLALPTAWAEPPAEPGEEPEKTEQLAQQKEASKKDQLLDQLFNKLEVEIEKEGSLSDEERAEISKELSDAKSALKDLEEITISVDGEDTVMGMIIGLVAVILIFGGPIIIVAIALHSSVKKRHMTHETINNYVQAGKDIPAEVLQGLQKQEDPKSNLHKGLVMIAIGLGIIGFFIIIDSYKAVGLGLIPLFIGLAQLLVWKLESKNNLNS